MDYGFNLWMRAILWGCECVCRCRMMYRGVSATTMNNSEFMNDACGETRCSCVCV